MILLDLQKAFNTVDHNILFSKLRAAGAEPCVVTWFDSYHSDHKQGVQVNVILLSPENDTCGVPSG